MRFPERIFLLRKAIGWSQSKLQATAKLPPGTIYTLESGRVQEPSLTVASRVVAAFQKAGLPGVTAELIFASDEPEARS